MRYKNLPESDKAILSLRCASGAERWATAGKNNGKLHPTMDTYYEGFRKGATAALSLPHLEFAEMSVLIDAIGDAVPTDGDLREKVWHRMLMGDNKDIKSAIEDCTKPEAEPQIEAADPDKEEDEPVKLSGRTVDAPADPIPRADLEDSGQYTDRR